MLRIKAGLSTYEDEAAKLGRDWREVAAQRAKEEKVFVGYGLDFSLDAQRAGNNEARNTMNGGKAGGKADGANSPQQQNAYADFDEEGLD